jgi:hypothetical protein
VLSDIDVPAADAPEDIAPPFSPEVGACDPLFMVGAGICVASSGLEPTLDPEDPTLDPEDSAPVADDGCGAD